MSTKNYRDAMIKNYGTRDNVESYSPASYIKKFAITKIQRDIARGFLGDKGWKPTGLVKKIMNGTRLTSRYTKDATTTASTSFDDLFKRTINAPVEPLQTHVSKLPNSKIKNKSKAVKNRIYSKHKKISLGDVDITSGGSLKSFSVNMTASDVTSVIGSSNKNSVHGMGHRYTKNKLKPHLLRNNSDYVSTASTRTSTNWGQRANHSQSLVKQSNSIGKTGAYSKLDAMSSHQSKSYAKVAAMMRGPNALSNMEDLVNIGFNSSPRGGNLRYIMSKKTRTRYHHYAESVYKTTYIPSKTVRSSSLTDDLLDKLNVSQVDKLEELNQAKINKTISTGDHSSKTNKIITDNIDDMKALKDNRKLINKLGNMQQTANDVVTHGSANASVHKSLTVVNQMVEDIAKSPSAGLSQKTLTKKAMKDLGVGISNSSATFAANASKHKLATSLMNVGAKAMSAVAAIQLAQIAAIGAIKGVEAVGIKLDEMVYELSMKSFKGSIVDTETAANERREALSTVAFNHNISKQFLGMEAAQFSRK